MIFTLLLKMSTSHCDMCVCNILWTEPLEKEKESEKTCILWSFDDFGDSETIFLTGDMFDSFFEEKALTDSSNGPNSEYSSTEFLAQNSLNDAFRRMEVATIKLKNCTLLTCFSYKFIQLYWIGFLNSLTWLTPCGNRPNYLDLYW